MNSSQLPLPPPIGLAMPSWPAWSSPKVSANPSPR